MPLPRPAAAPTAPRWCPSCAAALPDGALLCHSCGQACPQGGARQQPFCSCGGTFVNSYCASCGIRRPDDDDQGSLHPEDPVGYASDRADFAAPLAVEPAEPSLCLAIFLALGRRWLPFHLHLSVPLLLMKGFGLEYPPKWQVGELVLLLVSIGILRVQQPWGNFGNKAQSASSMAGFLSLGALEVLLVGYFCGMQVYVLGVEYFFGWISLLLLAGQWFFGALAGLSFLTTKQDQVVLSIGASAMFFALVLVIILVSEHRLSLGTFYVFLVLGGILTLASLGAAAAAGIFLVQDET